MNNGWSKERRAQQAINIQNWNPWKKSTGPKTKEGKMKSAGNAYKGGKRLKFRMNIKRLRLLMQSQKDGIKNFFL